MKTLKIIALLCLILGFTSKVNAQTVVTKEFDNNASFGIDCNNEWASGTIHFKLMLHFDKEGSLIRWQQLVTGEFKGETSGTIYSLKGIWQDNLQLVAPNGALTDNSQIIYRLRGESGLYKGFDFKFHGLWHFVYTPDGDLQVAFWKPFFECE
jgi:hypothetical protein